MRRTKDRDGGQREEETARRRNEEMEVKGQEEGGEGSSDPSQLSLLKCVWSAHVCVSYLSYVQ